VVIYRSWLVGAEHGLYPPTLWPHEFITAVIKVVVAEEVVTDTDETTHSP
jgi:hypothetical protein